MHVYQTQTIWCLLLILRVNCHIQHDTFLKNTHIDGHRKQSEKEKKQPAWGFVPIKCFFHRTALEKNGSQLHLLAGKVKLTDEWRFWREGDGKWERKPQREGWRTRKWNVIGTHTRSNLATCQSKSCLIRHKSEAPGRRAVSQDDTLFFMNGVEAW